MGLEWLWVPFTLGAALAQTARNSLQRDLTIKVGTVGATHVRFLYGFPFALLFLVLLSGATGQWPPMPSGAALGWALVGGLSQIVATALLLAAMRTQSFLVAIAYTKSEPVLVLSIAAFVLNESISPVQVAAIFTATGGVMLMSWPGRAQRGTDWLRPVLFGLGSGALFAVSAVSYRAGIQTFEAGFVLSATTMLVLSLALQSVGLSAWLAWRDPATLRTLIETPLRSAPAGLAGAVASQLWFLAFALQTTALVRTLALSEMLFAQVVTRRFFKQDVSPRDYAGVLALSAGLLGLFLG